MRRCAWRCWRAWVSASTGSLGLDETLNTRARTHILFENSCFHLSFRVRARARLRSCTPAGGGGGWWWWWADWSRWDTPAEGASSNQADWDIYSSVQKSSVIPRVLFLFFLFPILILERLSQETLWTLATFLKKCSFLFILQILSEDICFSMFVEFEQHPKKLKEYLLHLKVGSNSNVTKIVQNKHLKLNLPIFSLLIVNVLNTKICKKICDFLTLRGFVYLNQLRRSRTSMEELFGLRSLTQIYYKYR